MENTKIKIQLLDSSEDCCVCFGDILTVPYSTPEELFTAVYGTENIGVPTNDIRTGLDENNNPQIEIDFYLDKHYYDAFHNGLIAYNKITSLSANTERNLTATQYSRKDKEITDEEAESIINGEMINAGTNTPMQRVFNEDNDEEVHDEKKWLQHIQELNNDAQEVLDNMHDLIVHLKGYKTFYYFYHMLIDESIRIENTLYEKFNTYK